MSVYIRLAQNADMPAIMMIINQAKELLKRDGSPQWQDGHPNRQMFQDDIIKKRAYVLIVDQEVAGVAVLQTTPDHNYDEITGAWQNTTTEYATIHRIAISDQYRGQHLGMIFISNLLSRGVFLGFHNFRIDTHALNKRMQGLIKKSGYQYRGVIQVDPTPDGARYAYELNL
ncbi:GNAT family N-acetyltransferase [Lactobacillus sp. ESL0679]|uniref:GNAT family N-acetyltransferase n=1 Tax=Lactobacillus sp. ESL0679 TaxID=2983209 RepID=UPI0023F8C594|nr:GNAT family N-acetyltransferase [Lactobacillus sp. ESL0679]MDF7683595.1 GNAT family N-acetyltransferase [Lactobacillus sp. ESL0679]